MPFAGLYALLPDWSALDSQLQRNLTSHGDFPKWRRALAQLPPAHDKTIALEDTITVKAALSAADQQRLHTALQALHPWRKGPFSLCGIHIDSEWRSDFKWRRVAPHIDLRGQRILDVGCGNGYYGWRMLGAGARFVVGVDPSVLYCLQHQAVNHFIGDSRNQVLPLTLETLPEELSAARFDAAFSMGVIYHRREPLDHLRRLRQCLVDGGLLVVESLAVEGDRPLVPRGRYARMRNVWQIPTPRQLLQWLAETGFRNARIADTATTATAEQRTTSWMRFDSLAEALHPQDPTRTIEGHPAPRRCMAIAQAGVAGLEFSSP